MRNISTALQIALNNTNGVKANARLQVYKSRIFIKSSGLNTSYTATGAQDAGVHPDTAVYQDCAFDSTLGKVVTVTVRTNGLSFYIEGSATEINIETDVAQNTRPTLVSPYVFWFNSVGSIIRATYDLTVGTLSDQTTIFDNSGNTFEDTSIGSVFGIDAYNAIALRIDDGGVGITHYFYSDSSWQSNNFPERIMFPDTVWGSSQICRLNYASVAKTPAGIFVYLTTPLGAVKGIKLLPNGSWTDIFTAIPEDLTAFYISNCVVDSYNRIHLCGQFVRTGEFNSGATYNMAIWSDDGKVFSLDRFTVFSSLGYRFMLSLGRSSEIFSDMNRTAVCDSSYVFYRVKATRLENVSVINLSGTTSSGWTVTIPNGDRKYDNSPLMKRGNFVKLEIGVETGGSILWEEYQRCVIAKGSSDLTDGSRSLDIQILPEGLWRTSAITYPFYLEIQSKQSILDDVDAMDNLYTAPNSHGVGDPFCVMFSLPEKPFEAQAKVSGTVDHWSGNLISELYLEQYPVIYSLPLTIKLFGWSRIGLMDTNPNTADNTDATSPNDTFTPMFLVEGEDGEERTVVIENSEAVNGINYPPQTWKTGNVRANTGTYPVIHVSSTSGLLVGDKIKKVGVRVSSTGPTVHYLERMEIPEVLMYYTATFYGGTLGEEYSWEPIEYTPPTPIELPPIEFPPLVFPTPIPIGQTCMDGTTQTGPYNIPLKQTILRNYETTVPAEPVDNFDHLVQNGKVFNYVTKQWEIPKPTILPIKMSMDTKAFEANIRPATVTNKSYLEIEGLIRSSNNIGLDEYGDFYAGNGYWKVEALNQNGAVILTGTNDLVTADNAITRVVRFNPTVGTKVYGFRISLINTNDAQTGRIHKIKLVASESGLSHSGTPWNFQALTTPGKVYCLEEKGHWHNWSVDFNGVHHVNPTEMYGYRIGNYPGYYSGSISGDRSLGGIFDPYVEGDYSDGSQCRPVSTNPSGWGDFVTLRCEFTGGTKKRVRLAWQAPQPVNTNIGAYGGHGNPTYTDGYGWELYECSIVSRQLIFAVSAMRIYNVCL